MKRLLALTVVTALLAFAGCKPKAPDYGAPAVTISPSELTYAEEGGEQSLKLNATVDWILDGYSDQMKQWVTITPVSGAPSKDAQPIKVKVSANKNVERTATINFVSIDRKLKAKLVVSQKPHIPETMSDMTVANVVKTDGYKYQRYQLKGVVKNLTDAEAGVFTLVDNTGSILVNGLGKSEVAFGTEGRKEFASLNVKMRDIVTIIGYRVVVDGKPQMAYSYLVKSDAYTEPDPDKMEVKNFPFSADFKKGLEGFVVNNKVFPYEFDAIWTNSPTEGMVANAYNPANKFATESWLYSPKINMAGAKKPIMVFSHVVNFFKDLEVAKQQTTLLVRKGTEAWKPIPISFSYPDEMGSVVMISEDINLSSYIGSTIQFAFKYVSSGTYDAGKWQILDFTLKENEEPVQGDNSGSTEDYNKPGWNW